MWLGSYTVHWELQLPVDTKDDTDTSITTQES